MLSSQTLIILMHLLLSCPLPEMPRLLSCAPAGGKVNVATSDKGKSAARPAAANGITEVSDEESDEDYSKPLGMSHGSGKAGCPA